MTVMTTNSESVKTKNTDDDNDDIQDTLGESAKVTDEDNDDSKDTLRYSAMTKNKDDDSDDT